MIISARATVLHIIYYKVNSLRQSAWSSWVMPPIAQVLMLRMAHVL